MTIRKYACASKIAFQHPPALPPSQSDKLKLAEPRRGKSKQVTDRGEGGGERGEAKGEKWRDYLNIPYLRFVRRSPGQ